MNILIMAPNFQLLEVCKKIIPQYQETIEVLLGDLQDGLRITKNEISKCSIDIIISRGGTASLLRENLDIPVFDIDVTGFDLLRVIQPHSGKGERIAVIGYENVVSGAKSIADILGLNLGYFLVTKDTDMDSLIQDVKRWGTDVVIGDTVSVRTARNDNIRADIITSGPEAITQALNSAIAFYRKVQTEMVRNRRLNLILEHSDQGIIYINSKNRIELINSAAETILDRPKSELNGANIEHTATPEAIRNVIKQGPGEHVVKSGEHHLIAEVIPLGRTESIRSKLVFIQSSGRIRHLDVMIRKRMTSRGLVAGYNFKDFVGADPGFHKTIIKAQKYAATDSSVLLLGETGVGKEFFAQSIHNGSNRSNGPFVAGNCAALPDSLLESELFGYADGAFTGARKGGKPGLFEMAHLGTIFLDEVNDMSMKVQARFLRVLQEKQLMRVGDDRLYEIDVRVIAASNKNLINETENGDFRKDLYYRLRVLDIQIPPLRDRKSDIIPLLDFFMGRFSKSNGYEMPKLPGVLFDRIQEYSWPGNIRQLRNFAEKTCILNSIHGYSDELVADLILEIQSDGNDKTLKKTTEIESKTLEEIEHNFIRQKWENNGRNISKTARDLNLDRATVRKKLGLNL